MLFLIEKMGNAKHVVVWCMQIVECGTSSKLIQEKQKVDKVVWWGFWSGFEFPQVIIYDGKTCEVKKRIARFKDVVCLT